MQEWRAFPVIRADFDRVWYKSIPMIVDDTFHACERHFCYRAISSSLVKGSAIMIWEPRLYQLYIIFLLSAVHLPALG